MAKVSARKSAALAAAAVVAAAAAHKDRDGKPIKVGDILFLHYETAGVSTKRRLLVTATVYTDPPRLVVRAMREKGMTNKTEGKPFPIPCVGAGGTLEIAESATKRQVKERTPADESDDVKLAEKLENGEELVEPATEDPDDN